MGFSDETPIREDATRGESGVNGTWEFRKGVAVVSSVYAIGRVLCRYGGVPEEAHHAWATKFMQTAHSIGSSALGYSCAVEIFNTSKVGYKPNHVLSRQMWWELSYYCVDLMADTVNSLKKRDLSLTLLGFQAHHLVPIVASFTVSEWRSTRVTKATDWVLAMLFVANFSSIFQHSLWFFDRIGISRSRPIYKANLVAFLVSFVLIRFYGLAALLRKFSQMDDDGPPSISRAIQKMPTVCRVSTAFLTFLNIVWCVMNLNNKMKPLLTGRS